MISQLGFFSFWSVNFCLKTNEFARMNLSSTLRGFPFMNRWIQGTKQKFEANAVVLIRKNDRFEVLNKIQGQCCGPDQEKTIDSRY